MNAPLSPERAGPAPMGHDLVALSAAAGAESFPWSGSPHEAFHRFSSGRKGRTGEKLVEEWARRSAVEVGKKTAGCDLHLDGEPVEVKIGSSRSIGGFKVQANHVPVDPTWSFLAVVCVGFGIDDIGVLVLPRAFFLSDAIRMRTPRLALYNQRVEGGAAKTLGVDVDAFFPAERLHDAWLLAHRPVEEISAFLRTLP